MNGKRIVVATFLALLLPGPTAAQQGAGLQLSQEARENLGIELEAAGPRAIHDVLNLRGLIREQSDRVAWVTPTARGQIVEVLAREAEAVEAGQVLLTLFCPELEKLRSALARGLERETLLAGEVERTRSLVDRQVLSNRDLLRAEAELSAARADVWAARRGILILGMTERELDRLLEDPDRPAWLPVHAPIAGSITARKAYIGEMVEPGRKLMEIMDTSVLWAEADVFEKDVPRLAEGQEVWIWVRAFVDWSFQGEIRAISADMHPQKRTAHLWIEVENPDGRLMPQMAVDLSILLQKKAEVLAVPRRAVLEDQGEAFVFVLNGDAFLKQPVVTGLTDHMWCEIREGLYEGDRVVTRGNHELRLAISAGGPPLGSDGHLHQH